MGETTRAGRLASEHCSVTMLRAGAVQVLALMHEVAYLGVAVLGVRVLGTAVLQPPHRTVNTASGRRPDLSHALHSHNGNAQAACARNTAKLGES